MEIPIKINPEHEEEEAIVEGQSVSFQEEGTLIGMQPRVFRAGEGRYVVNLTIQAETEKFHLPIPLPIYTEITGKLLNRLIDEEELSVNDILPPKREEYRP